MGGELFHGMLARKEPMNERWMQNQTIRSDKYGEEEIRCAGAGRGAN
jgi:hypothetical protein